jgi:nucleoside phosphorylase
MAGSLRAICLFWLTLVLSASASHAGVPEQVLVVTGLQQEAEIAKGPGVTVVLTGGSLRSAMQRLELIDPSRVRVVISFGIAGGLVSPLRVGSVALATEVRADDGTVYPVSRALTATIINRLTTQGIDVTVGPWYAQQAPTLSAQGKMALRLYSGTIATDTETLSAAIWADQHHIPFAVLRTITDPVEVSLPPAAYHAVKPDGSYNVGGVILQTLLNPLQIPSLMSTASDASIGFGELRRCRRIVDLGSL